MKIFRECDILLPKDVDFKKWSVVACDQHTQDKKFWDDLEKLVGKSPSTLKLIVPEAYLESVSSLTTRAHKTMKKYITEGVFETLKNSVIYVERTLSNGKTRKGLVGAIDLEKYSEDITKKGTKILPSEATVEKRVPPRIKIRKGACLDLPHAVIFCNDPKAQVIKFAKAQAQEKTKLYDFNLSANGGHITGYKICGKNAKAVAKVMNENISKNALIVADGNHSLVAAKRVYEEYKKSHENHKTSPLRFVLVEIVNLFDDAICMEPIHRVLKNVDTKLFITEFEKNIFTSKHINAKNLVQIIIKNCKKQYQLTKNALLPIEQIQKFLDEFVAKFGGEIDYIHSAKEVEEIGKQKNCVGILLPAITKIQFAKRLENGTLWPRKTFSIGTETDKRYYLEAREL